ncbi:MAG: ATP-binding cassette domain-containing protein, partial [Sporomusaceae bacterium]|nr:ATP-binding cassette domain-containing protein [Sporomusaceae bacterium]
MKYAVELNSLSKKYGNRLAVDNLTLSIAQGEIFGLVGPDAAGKTTAMRLMLGILEPASGTAVVLGTENIETIKGQLGYVPQKFSLYGDLTVRENINFLGSLYGASQRVIDQKADKILAFTNLLAFQDRLADNLSGGMKQKLALAAGLMHRPQIFFLDEPTTGVDPVSRREFWQLLYRLNKEDGITIVVSTPYMDEAELCTQIAFLHQGQLVSCGTPDQLKKAYPYQLLELTTSCPDIKKYLPSGILKDFNAFGDKYHLAVENAAAAKKTISQILQAAEIEPFALNPIQPSLEDMFINLASPKAEIFPATAAPMFDTPVPNIQCAENAVVTHDLTRVFGKFTAVNKINLTIPQGSIYGFLGPNGSGKSTTIKMLCGILTPSRGSGSILGLDLAAHREEIKHRLGYMSQKFSLYDDLTIRENLEFYAGLYSLTGNLKTERLETMLQMAGLEARQNQLTATLSGGFRQRLALGCSILHNPPLLFLDEPTGGVDPKSRRLFWDIIYNLSRQGTTIMVTTHFMDEAEHCDKIGFIFAGNLIAADTPQNLKKSVQGHLLRLETPDPLALLKKILAQKLPHLDLYISGLGLNALVHPRDTPAWQKLPHKIIAPSLEDVFINYV